MQTFLAYPSFLESARVLDVARLGKQRPEALGILTCIREGRQGWEKHPAREMWEQWPLALAAYGIAIADEWRSRGYEDTTLEKFHRAFEELIEEREPEIPPWLGEPKLHASHRSRLRTANPLWYSQWGWSEPLDQPYWWPTKEGYVVPRYLSEARYGDEERKAV